jgi:large subunit ribosomal protein L6
MHGLYRSLLNNLVKGVTDGYKKELELVGVGFKASNKWNILDLALGYSHNIIFEIPKELKVTTSHRKR